MLTDTVKGFNDYTGKTAQKREVVKQVIAGTFNLYGFEPAETPVVEFEEFVKGENKNDEAVSDIFKLNDKGKRALALRYELTFQLKRISKNKKLPYRRYQIGEVFRDEPVSSNRFRQFVQCDADIIGSSIKDDAEMLALASEIFSKLGIEFTIYFNNRKLLNEIFDKEGIKNKEEVMREIDKIDKLPEEVIKENLKKFNAEKILSIFKKPESYFEKYPAYKEIRELKDLCKTLDVTVSFQPSLARGLSYYNGTVFEIKTKGVKETICAGGAYLVNNLQSTGISFGLERISELAKIESAEKRVLIISIGQDEESIGLAKSLRAEGIPCFVMFGKISKALEFANSYSLPYVIFFGEEEAKKKKVKLRDMKSGKEEMISAKDIAKKLN